MKIGCITEIAKLCKDMKLCFRPGTKLPRQISSARMQISEMVPVESKAIVVKSRFRTECLNTTDKPHHDSDL